MKKQQGKNPAAPLFRRVRRHETPPSGDAPGRAKYTFGLPKVVLSYAIKK